MTTATDPPGTANDPLASSWAAGLRSTARAFARDHLPEAMVPAHYIVLPRLPKLPNGKVDRSALPAPTVAETTDTAYTAPRSAVESQLARIWQDLLALPRVGVETDFFDLGGNSLSVLQMSAQVRELYGVRLDLRRLFEEPTIARLARMVSLQADPAVTGAGNPRGVSDAEMLADARLPEDIRPQDGVRPARTGPDRSILLTGGTGYTGAFLLRELLDRSAGHVHVLVRADDPAQARERVRANLAEFGLWHDADAGRVTGVPGDTGRPYLGLGRADYRRLAAEVDVIVHNAAISSWIVPYSKIKPVNVLGAQEVLRLACRDRLKTVHFVSTIGVFPGHTGARHWPEEPVADPHGVVGGYRQSKWVAEALMLTARERGVPTHVYRLGAVTGAQTTGACSTDTFINHLIKGCIQIGAYLDFDLLLDLVPVDFCAATVAHCAVGGGSPHPIVNVPSPRASRMNDIFELIVGHGYPLRRLPYQDWYRELVAAVERGEENELRLYLPLFGEEQPAEEVGYLGSEPSFATDHLREAIAGTGIACRPLDQDLMDRYLRYFGSIGFLPAPTGPSGTGDRGSHQA
jgi:thioester reductase-like protein